MRHSLHSHIIYLEDKIQSLRDRLTTSHLSSDEIQGLKAQIFHAELALEHYREAYTLELSVSSPDPPDGSQTTSDGGADTQINPKAEKKKKEGLAAIAAPARRKARAGLLRGLVRYHSGTIHFR